MTSQDSSPLKQQPLQLLSLTVLSDTESGASSERRNRLSRNKMMSKLVLREGAERDFCETKCRMFTLQNSVLFSKANSIHFRVLIGLQS